MTEREASVGVGLERGERSYSHPTVVGDPDGSRARNLIDYRDPQLELGGVDLHAALDVHRRGEFDSRDVRRGCVGGHGVVVGLTREKNGHENEKPHRRTHLI